MEKVVILKASNNAYSIKHCGNSMTISELVSFLQNNFSSSDKIYLSFDGGYTYGSIYENRFCLRYLKEDD